MQRTPYIIIELANTHGGDQSYLEQLIHSFKEYTGSYGMKFQPLSPNTLATTDFEWYKVYEELYFTPDIWKKILKSANETKDVWLDIFDAYGVQILKENQDLVHGIKFQSSVLYNYEVLSQLNELDLTNCKIILNVAAQNTDQISERISFISSKLKPKEILVEIGFQSYPTQLEDSGLCKIKPISEQTHLPIVFADHVEGTSDDAIYLPILALREGVQVIEKHVMLSDRETKYDHFSSLTPERFKVLVDKISRYSEAFSSDFINDREIEYLHKTVMIPVLKNNLASGDLINDTQDVQYRRSGKNGLTLEQISIEQRQFKILNKEKDQYDTIQLEDFKKAKIGVIVACRMKSSRLKEKAILPIGNLPSVEFCLEHALRFENVDEVILATSNLEQDAILSKHTFSNKVKFYQGDPEDVMDRYIGACDTFGLDVVIRVTADMPYIDNEICQIILNEHFKNGADYTVAKNAAIGVNLEVFNVSILKKVKSHFPSANYSEYMTWYFQNNPDYVKIHFVDLPEIFTKPYRLTLDYEEDLELFSAIESHFLKENKLNHTLRDVIDFLNTHPEIATINSHLTLKYKTDQTLIDALNEHTKIKS